MRQQYHFRESDQGLLTWDVTKLIRRAQTLPVIELELSSITEYFEDYWYRLGKGQPTCEGVVAHMRLIQQADLSYPIILCHQGRLMDGMHRVCKAHLEQKITIAAVQFPAYIAPDFIGVDPSDLPY